MVYKVYIGKLAFRLGCARAICEHSRDSKVAFNLTRHGRWSASRHNGSRYRAAVH